MDIRLYAKASLSFPMSIWKLIPFSFSTRDDSSNWSSKIVWKIRFRWFSKLRISDVNCSYVLQLSSIGQRLLCDILGGTVFPFGRTFLSIHVQWCCGPYIRGWPAHQSHRAAVVSGDSQNHTRILVWVGTSMSSFFHGFGRVHSFGFAIKVWGMLVKLI